MTTEQPKKHKSFEHYCTCGGYAYEMNGRNPEQPHMIWCPQRDEWIAWKQSLKNTPTSDKLL